jgi:hypothetical protein
MSWRGAALGNIDSIDNDALSLSDCVGSNSSGTSITRLFSHVDHF